MAKGRLRRCKIGIKPRAEIRSLSPSGRFELFLGQKGTVDCLDLMDLHDGERIVKELSLYVREMRASRKVANTILKYLRYTLKLRGVVGSKSLDSYKRWLSDRSDIELSTKYQIYQTTKNFVEHYLAATGDHGQKLPKGFDWKKAKKKSKRSFAEIGRRYVEDERNYELGEVNEVSEVFEIDPVEARALILSLQCIDILHEQALEDVQAWERDWDYVESVISNLSPEELKKLKGIESFIDEYSIEKRTPSEACAILYAKFGSAPPAVRFWPRGIEDVLRHHGWKKISSRVSKLLGGLSCNEEDDAILSFVQSVSPERLNIYRTVDTYSHAAEWRDPRSIELAISILYAKFGRLIPDSCSWPEGLADYLRNRDWSIVRTRSSFFPTTKSITPFIVGLLSSLDLSPNVDTVAQYTYLNSFKPAEEEGKIAIFLDKYRGGALSKDVDGNDPIVAACVRHTTRLRRVLQDLGEEGKKILRLEKAPLWLQFTPNASLDEDYSIRPPEVSTVTGLVRWYIRKKKNKHPVLEVIREASGENFRPTCALILKLTGESSGKIQQILNHAHAQTTHTYTQRLYTQSLLKTKAKRFQQYLVDMAKDIKSHLNLDESKFKYDLPDATNEGVDEWLNCEAQRVWFHDPDIIAEWVAWERTITTAEPELSLVNPKRWQEYWLPRLVRYRSMLSLVSAVDMKVAEEASREIVLPPLS